jgi:haloalkane dehalogenase
VQGLRGQFRCVALDYPGFGLSTAPPGYRYTVAEHASVVEGFVEQLDTRDITLMVQDWGGPIGFWVATRHTDRFRAFVIGNTWAWPIRDDRSIEWFSKTLGSKQLGGVLVKQADVFVNLFMKGGIRRKRLSIDEQFMYRRPHPTPESREPVHVMPREILAAHDLLADVEQGLARAEPCAIGKSVSCGTANRIALFSALRHAHALDAGQRPSGARNSTRPPLSASSPLAK